MSDCSRKSLAARSFVSVAARIMAAFTFSSISKRASSSERKVTTARYDPGRKMVSMGNVVVRFTLAGGNASFSGCVPISCRSYVVLPQPGTPIKRRRPYPLSWWGVAGALPVRPSRIVTWAQTSR